MGASITKITRFCSVLILVQGAVLHGQELKPGLQKKTEPPETTSENQASPQFLNRTLLTVGRDTYTMLDALCLLGVWNSLGPEPVALTTNWRTFEGISIDPEKTIRDNLVSWPADVQRLLFLGFVGAESKRLNLFVPAERDLDAALKRTKGLLVEMRLAENAREYLLQGGDETLRKYIDLVLRTVTFQKFKGDLAKNQSMTKVLWYWHQQTSLNAEKVP